MGKPEDLRTRTKRFALRVIHLYSALPKKTEAQVKRLSELMKEADELTAILVTCVKNTNGSGHFAVIQTKMASVFQCPASMGSRHDLTILSVLKLGGDPLCRL